MQLAGAVTLGLGDPELVALKDAGQRMADALNAKVVFGKIGETFGRWMAFRLEDGSSDGTLYDTREDAIRYRGFGKFWFEPLRPSSYSADECALTLQYARAAYDAGWRPDLAYPSPIAPVRIEDAHRKVRQLRRHARRR